MKIRYNFKDNFYSFFQPNELEKNKLSFLLSNNKGDFIQLPVDSKKSVDKFLGLNITNPKTLEVFKVIDSIFPQNLEVDEIEYDGYKVKRYYKSSLNSSVESIDNLENLNNKNSDINYDESGRLIDNSDLKEVEIKTYDQLYLAPMGGLVYEIFNYEGGLYLDLDPRRIDDFNSWGREFEIYKKDDVLFIKYQKFENNQEKYNLFIGIKTPNFSYDLLKEWVKKEYFYSKKRKSLYEWYVYRALRVDIFDSKRIIISASFSEDEVLKQIGLIEKNQQTLEKFDEDIYEKLTQNEQFNIPLVENVGVAYRLSSFGMYKFLHKNLDYGLLKEGIYAGYPWFCQVWSRDELVSLRAFINKGEYRFVKDKIMYYLNLLNDRGEIPVIVNNDNTIYSIDATFWLAKRIEDFIFHLNEEDKLDVIFSRGELAFIYDKFKDAFKNIVSNHWDREKELIRVERGVSWMDTLEIKYPLDIQVQFLNFVSFISILADLLGRKVEIKEYLDFEILLKSKIVNTYYRNAYLFDDIEKDTFNVNVFLAYYFFPDLLFKKDWKKVFDRAISTMWNSWGGFSSLSKKDFEYKKEYSGEDNLSYHRGDSWFFMNNIAAICLNDLDEKHYRKYIQRIIRASSNDILRFGTIGFASEISSSIEQRSEGCFAQSWSTTTFIEMIDNVFRKRRKFDLNE